MHLLNLDDIASIELAMDAKRRHLRDSVSEITRRSRPAHLVSLAGERLGARTSDVLDTAKNRMRGATMYWATLALGAAGLFELGRWSSQRERVKADAVPAEAAAESSTSEARGGDAVSGEVRTPLKMILLAALGLAGGFIVSAIAPRLPAEAEVTQLASDRWRKALSDVIGSNGSGLLKLLLTYSNVSRYASTAMIVMAIGEMLFPFRPTPQSQRMDID